MKYDEFAFLNQQLANMLKVGVPLEGGLRQLAESMRRGELRSELLKLESDLGAGIPLREALASRKLPALYVNMVLAGVQGNNLPGILLLIADYYHRLNSIGSRLNGLMVYPLMVLCFSGALSVFMTLILLRVTATLVPDTEGLFEGSPWVTHYAFHWLSLWIPIIGIGLLSLATVAGLAIPRLRRYLRWRLPAFREANLSQSASALHLMLRGGSTLGDALALLIQLEHDTPAGEELVVWKQNLSDGRGNFIEIAVPGKIFPPLFVWIVANAEEDLAEGFRRASEIYHARALYRIEMFLYAALPAAVMVLGLLVLSQAYGIASMFIQWLRMFYF